MYQTIVQRHASQSGWDVNKDQNERERRDQAKNEQNGLH
jgi:hypothetical protein